MAFVPLRSYDPLRVFCQDHLQEGHRCPSLDMHGISPEQGLSRLKAYQDSCFDIEYDIAQSMLNIVRIPFATFLRIPLNGEPKFLSYRELRALRLNDRGISPFSALANYQFILHTDFNQYPWLSQGGGYDISRQRVPSSFNKAFEPPPQEHL